MGISANKDIVPFAAEYAISASYCDDDILMSLIEPESWASDKEDEAEEDGKEFSSDHFLNNLTINGWSLDYNGNMEPGKKGTVHGFRWTKGDLFVWLVNQSQYANGGDYEIAICGHDEPSIKEFMSDFSDMITFNDSIGANVPIVTFT